MNLPVQPVRTLNSIIRAGGYDFIDFGCSKGGSLKLGHEFFGGARGIGIDIDPAKVAATRAAGHDAHIADATNLRLPKGAVSFVLLMHFVEHLPGFDVARRAIESACSAARDFVFIRHPWFDSDGALFALGLKFYWSDWHGHPNHFGKIDFHKVLARNPKVHRWYLFGYDRVEDSLSPDLIELDGPRDSSGASAEELAARERKPFAFQTYRQIACLIQINPDFDVAKFFPSLEPRHELIYDSQSASVLSGAGERVLEPPAPATAPVAA